MVVPEPGPGLCPWIASGLLSMELQLAVSRETEAPSARCGDPTLHPRSRQAPPTHPGQPTLSGMKTEDGGWASLRLALGKLQGPCTVAPTLWMGRLSLCLSTQRGTRPAGSRWRQGSGAHASWTQMERAVRTVWGSSCPRALAEAPQRTETCSEA